MPSRGRAGTARPKHVPGSASAAAVARAPADRYRRTAPAWGLDDAGLRYRMPGSLDDPAIQFGHAVLGLPHALRGKAMFQPREAAMNLQEAIKIALEYENKVRDHYAKGAKAIQDAQGRKVFETLAKEEQGHVDYLQFCLDQWTKTGKVNITELKTVLPKGTEWIVTARKRLEKNPSKRVASANELELLKLALQMEVETSGFYRDLVGKLASADQALFAKFLDIEEGHVAIVQAELDSVQGLGYWFDVQEFALEGG